MRLAISAETLRRFMENDPDCEALSEDEYIADIYDANMPVTLDIKLNKDGAELIAAAALIYDEAQDGWYMGEQIDDIKRVEQVLLRALDAGNGR